MQRILVVACAALLLVAAYSANAQAVPQSGSQSMVAASASASSVPQPVALAYITAGYFVIDKCNQYAGKIDALCFTQSVDIKRTSYNKKYFYFTSYYEVLLKNGDTQATRGSGRVPLDPNAGGKRFRVTRRYNVHR
jgi:hypothetical protein